MENPITTKKSRKSWARYPKELGSVRLTTALSDDLARVCTAFGINTADYVRAALAERLPIHVAAIGAKSAAQLDAQTATQATQFPR